MRTDFRKAAIRPPTISTDNRFVGSAVFPFSARDLGRCAHYDRDRARGRYDAIEATTDAPLGKRGPTPQKPTRACDHQICERSERRAVSQRFAIGNSTYERRSGCRNTVNVGAPFAGYRRNMEASAPAIATRML